MQPTQSDQLNQLTTFASILEAQSAKLDGLVAELEKDLEQVKRNHLRRIKAQAGVVASAEAVLRSAVEGNPELFIKPRTLTASGIKFGYTSSDGRVTYTDAEDVIKAIRNKYTEDIASRLIRTKEEPNKDNIKTLSADELASIGCTIEGAGEVVLVKRSGGEIDAMINKLMRTMVQSMVEEGN